MRAYQPTTSEMEGRTTAGKKEDDDDGSSRKPKMNGGGGVSNLNIGIDRNGPYSFGTTQLIFKSGKGRSNLVRIINNIHYFWREDTEGDRKETVSLHPHRHITVASSRKHYSSHSAPSTTPRVFFDLKAKGGEGKGPLTSSLIFKATALNIKFPNRMTKLRHYYAPRRT